MRALAYTNLPHLVHHLSSTRQTQRAARCDIIPSILIVAYLFIYFCLNITYKIYTARIILSYFILDFLWIFCLFINFSLTFGNFNILFFFIEYSCLCRFDSIKQKRVIMGKKIQINVVWLGLSLGWIWGKSILWFGMV